MHLPPFLALLALTTALPQPAPPSDDTTFTLLATLTSTTFVNAPIVATRSGLQINYPQDASCTPVPAASATFSLRPSTGELLLHAAPTSSQLLYTDRSGFGQGVLAYTAAAGANRTLNPNRVETAGWSVGRTGELLFAGRRLVACPSGVGAWWTVWTDAGVAEPGFNRGCEGFVARVVGAGAPVGCVYSTA